MRADVHAAYRVPLLILCVALTSSCGSSSSQGSEVEEPRLAGPELEAELAGWAPTLPESIPSQGFARYHGYFVGDLSGVRDGQAFGPAELTATFYDGTIGGSFEMTGYWTDGSQQWLGSHRLSSALIGDGSFFLFLSDAVTGQPEGTATGQLVGPEYEGVVVEVDGSMGYISNDKTGQLYNGVLNYDGKISAVR